MGVSFSALHRGLVVSAVLLSFPLVPRQSRADDDQAFDLRSIAGRLVLVPRVLTGEQSEQNCWHSGQDGVDFEDASPNGYFNGRIFVRSHGEVLEVGGWRQNFHDWQVIDVAISQASQEVTAQYTVRTPVDMPDVTFHFTEPDLTLMLIRHPELTTMLAEVLEQVGEESSYEFDPAVRAQVEPCVWEEPPGVAESVAALLPQLESLNWREREQAEQGLTDLGRDGALYLLLRVDRQGLTPQQNLSIDQVIRRYPLLTAGDKEICRRDPSRLTMPHSGALGRAE
jgi:hypothetical protein